MHPKRLLKIVHQLGFIQVGLFALYKLRLKTGYYRWGTPQNLNTDHRKLNTLFTLPSREKLLSTLGEDGLQTLLIEANHIVDGKFRIFGSELTEIKLDFDHPLSHWADYETDKAQIPPTEYRKLNTALNLSLATCDLKLLWEPARFSWVFTLGRAYLASGDEKYAKAFWRYFEIFDKVNPVNMGPHWMNGQEVALRLMVFVWTAQVFSNSTETTAELENRITRSIAEHASRITPTLLYARSQNNNHLTSEAAALYTAALALPDHPKAEKWRKLGIKWLNWSFENQIDENGEYIQRSVNYHRLMLQLGLWVSAFTTKGHEVHEEKTKLSASSCASWMTQKTKENLSNAMRWLAELTDPISGNAINLGANDGAYIFPLANGDFRDFRPVVNAASEAFLDEKPFETGAWDEMSLWFNVESSTLKEKEPSNLAPCTLHPASSTWAHLRTANGNLRLAHADQLHLDLWWRGENIALDPGTYLYNAESPWDNPLPATEFHNTVTVNNQDQMTRASRFMYLDWSRGRVVEKSDSRIIAEHNGYRKSGVTHRRTVSFEENTWHVEDHLIPKSQLPKTYRLHWLLINGEWKVESRNKEIEMSLETSQGLMKLTLRSSLIADHSSSVTLARAGELLHGDAEIPPTRGWYSPTYGVKIPVLSLALEVTVSNEVQFITEFKFPDS
ncbi:MAG: alginate lyase family protein [Anaerolineae bacterium]|nr:alginate lyase family protein [Anaerolineae bacterium]MBT7071314.1 alginate lyase family protein [Anaerolineae bacterium]MBT7325938.1 alginate lyase family protein [Anaerolineae bacterium]